MVNLLSCLFYCEERRKNQIY